MQKRLSELDVPIEIGTKVYYATGCPACFYLECKDKEAHTVEYIEYEIVYKHNDEFVLLGPQGLRLIKQAMIDDRYYYEI